MLYLECHFSNVYFVWVLDLDQACKTLNSTGAISTKNYLSRAACYRCCNVNATVAAKTYCDCQKRKKQNKTIINSLPSYYNISLLFLILIGRKNLSLLCSIYLLFGLVAVFQLFFEIVTFSRKGQIIANYRNVRLIASIDNKSIVSTNLKKEV